MSEKQADTLANLAKVAKDAPETLSDLVDTSLSSARHPPKPAAKYRIVKLKIDTRKRLQNVVERLVADCVRFYRDDEEILNKMSTEALEYAVLEYLSKRDFYNRGLIEEVKR